MVAASAMRALAAASLAVSSPSTAGTRAEAVRELVLEQLYDRQDPFFLLTDGWIETGLKPKPSDIVKQARKAQEYEDEEEYEDDDDDDDDEGDEAAKEERRQRREEKAARERSKAEAAWRAEAERTRKETLLRSCNGHLEWLRARELRADLQPAKLQIASQQPRPASRHVEQRATASSSRPTWYRVKMPLTHGSLGDEVKEQVLCWRSDFVDEVRHIAEGRRMPLATVGATLASRAARANPGMLEGLGNHILAIRSDGSREFWSRSFVQLVSILHAQWKLNRLEVVRCAEEELRALHPEVQFDLDGLLFRPLGSRKASRLRVPKLLKDTLRTHGMPPPPPVPDRLPCRLTYKATVPWARVLLGPSSLPPLPELRPSKTEEYGEVDSDPSEVELMRSQSSELSPTSTWRVGMAPGGRRSGKQY